MAAACFARLSRRRAAAAAAVLFIAASSPTRASCARAHATSAAVDAPKQLRTCLTRHLLERIAEEHVGLAHLGIHHLHAPHTPPAFAAFAAEVSGHPAAVHHHLGPEEDYAGYTTSAGKRCLLAPSERVRRFEDPRLAEFLVALFRAIAQQRAPLVTLSPHCLFHAHMFVGRPPGGGLGLLFHACEYPAYDPDSFPYVLGHCQADSELRPTGQQLAQRNMLWYQGRLVVLDVSPGTPLRSLLWEETSELCTLYEEDWGLPVADVTLTAPVSGQLLVNVRGGLGRQGGQHGGDHGAAATACAA